MERFQELVLRLERRARLVRGLEGARLPLAAALLLTLGYQALWLVGLVGVQTHGRAPLLLMATLNLVFALGGFLWGYLLKVDLALVLFQADRRLGLHERLSSLYELSRGRGRAEFIPLLSARLPGRIESAEAIPLQWRRGWLLPAALLLATLLLGLPLHTPSVHPPPVAEQLAREKMESLTRRLAALEERLAELEGEIPALGQESVPGLLEEEAEARALQEELEEELWGSSAERPLQGEILEQLAQIGSSLAEGGGSALAELQEELNRLGSRLQEGVLKELLQQLPEDRDWTSTLRNLAAAQALAQRLAEARERLQQSEQLASQGSGGGGGEEEGGGSSAQGEGRSGRPSEEGPPGGEEAGTGLGAWPGGESGPLTWPSGVKEFHIPGELGEWGEVEQLITKGTPFEAGGAEASPSLQLNFQRVIAILESREVPQELQETVKRYFLIITEE